MQNPKTWITGLDELQNDLNKLENATDKAVRAFVGDIVQEYKAQAFVVGAVDTRHFVGTISARDFVVMSDADYSAIIEFGRKDTDRYPGRFPARRAMDKLHKENRFFNRLDQMFDEALNGQK